VVALEESYEAYPSWIITGGFGPDRCFRGLRVSGKYPGTMKANGSVTFKTAENEDPGNRDVQNKAADPK
jgi:hypothetical protein